MNSLYPFRLDPIYKRYLWGGRRFATVLGRPLAEGDDSAESWEVGGHPKGDSQVTAGPLAGHSVTGCLLVAAGTELCAAAAYLLAGARRHAPADATPPSRARADTIRDSATRSG